MNSICTDVSRKTRDLPVFLLSLKLEVTMNSKSKFLCMRDSPVFFLNCEARRFLDNIILDNRIFVLKDVSSKEE